MDARLKGLEMLGRIPRCARQLALALGIGAALAGPAVAQQNFPTADAAAAAFVDALATSDADAFTRILGAGWRSVLPERSHDDLLRFVAAAAKGQKIVHDDAHRAHLAVGETEWVLPIPIVEKGGAWHFDVRAAADEIRTRRIGRNELATIEAALAYYDAQRDYARADRNGDGVLEYAQRLVSRPGQKDGLYWETQPGEADSPLGELFADAAPGEGYHGYRFRILTAQGPAAPGGAYDYVVGGRMIAGFALLAWPLRYGDTGVTSFVVSHDGVVYEKDLGPKTPARAAAIKRFDPDSTWKKVAH